jgi:anti-sigma-K factor RskA
MDQTDMHVLHVGDLLDAYVLGALELEDVDWVERHLEICAGCRSMLEPSRRTAEELLIAVPPVAVPSGLRARMLARIHAEEREDRSGALLRTLLTQPNYIIWPMEGTVEAPGAIARLVTAPAHWDAVLIISGLRVPESGKLYQVWFLSGGRAVPNALFTVDRQGQGSSMLHLPASLSTIDSIAVTLEPQDGSPSPTGPAVLAGATRG